MKLMYFVAFLFIGLTSCGDSTSEVTRERSEENADAAASARAQQDFLPAGEDLDKVPQVVKDVMVDHRPIDDVTGHIDPVCGMKVSSETAHRYTYENVTYGYCSEVCRTAFSADPTTYLAALEE